MNEECLVGVRQHRAPTASLSFYTPPVAPTDSDVLVSCSDWQPQGRQKVLRTSMSGGRRNRNKAAVGANVGQTTNLNHIIRSRF
jgi:hypothetical protein